MDATVPMAHHLADDSSTLAAWQAGVRRHAGSHGLVLTPMRQRVLDLLRKADEPIGAYALRDCLEQTLSRRVSPPTVYRALDYLQRGGLATRIESRNAWIACDRPAAEGVLLYCVCSACGSVVQSQAVAAHAELLALASRRGFAARGCTLEVSGLCACCRAEGG